MNEFCRIRPRRKRKFCLHFNGGTVKLAMNEDKQHVVNICLCTKTKHLKKNQTMCAQRE